MTFSPFSIYESPQYAIKVCFCNPKVFSSWNPFEWIFCISFNQLGHIMVRVERLFHHHWQCRWGGWSRSLFLLYLLRSFLRMKRIWNAAISEAKNKTTIGRRDILCYWFIWITASLLFYNTKQISCYSENLQQWEAKKGFSVGVCIISGWYYTVFWLNFLWPLSMVWASRLLCNDSVMFQREQRE